MHIWIIQGLLSLTKLLIFFSMSTQNVLYWVCYTSFYRKYWFLTHDTMPLVINLKYMIHSLQKLNMPDNTQITPYIQKEQCLLTTSRSSRRSLARDSERQWHLLYRSAALLSLPNVLITTTTSLHLLLRLHRTRNSEHWAGVSSSHSTHNRSFSEKETFKSTHYTGIDNQTKEQQRKTCKTQK